MHLFGSIGLSSVILCKKGNCITHPQILWKINWQISKAHDLNYLKSNAKILCVVVVNENYVVFSTKKVARVCGIELQYLFYAIKYKILAVISLHMNKLPFKPTNELKGSVTLFFLFFVKAEAGCIYNSQMISWHDSSMSESITTYKHDS